LNAGLYTSLVIALTFSGAIWAWNSGRTIGTLARVVTLIGFIVQQFFAIFTTHEHQLFQIDFITSRTMVILHITTACASPTMFVAIYYVPLMFHYFPTLPNEGAYVANDPFMLAGLLNAHILMIFHFIG
jgi:hypothetical protein